MKRTFVLCALALMFLAGSAMADQIAVGTLEFNNVIPGDGGIGVNAFFTVNQSGNGPDFWPNPVVITGGHLVLYPSAGSPIEYFVSDLGGGQFFMSNLFPETTTFTSAVFTGLVSGLNWTVTGTLLPPGSASVLSAGGVSLITTIYANVEQTNGPIDPPANVPEPATLALLGSGFVAAFARRRRTRA